LSQALHHANRPAKAVEEAYRILEDGGRIIIIDLLEHDFEKARELYADVWLGFSQNKLYQLLKDAGFKQIEINIVSKETEEPYFQTILASAVKG
jgi:ArsR family transcriptional regulator